MVFAYDDRKPYEFIWFLWGQYFFLVRAWPEDLPRSRGGVRRLQDRGEAGGGADTGASQLAGRARCQLLRDAARPGGLPYLGDTELPLGAEKKDSTITNVNFSNKTHFVRSVVYDGSQLFSNISKLSCLRHVPFWSPSISEF